MDSKIRSVLSNLRSNRNRTLERNRPSSSEDQPSSTARRTNGAVDRSARPNRRTDTTLLDIHDRFDLPKPQYHPHHSHPERAGPVAIPINPDAPGADNFIPPNEYYEHIKEHGENWGGEPAGPVGIPRNPNAPGADDFILPHELERIKDRLDHLPVGTVPEGNIPVNVDDIGIDIFPDGWGQVVWEEPLVIIHPDRAREWTR
jgi:hypothetical protein